jgi:TRAP-type C4-dicarboxylate transport system permease small subunit
MTTPSPEPGAPSWSRDSLRRALRGRPLEEVVGVIVMMVLVLITFSNVLVRYLTSQSFAGTEEISVFLLVVVTLAGAAVVVARDAHIRIDFFYVRGSALRRRVLSILSTVATAALFLLLALLFARSGWMEYEFGETTTGLGLPRWWYTIWIPLLALLVAVRAITGHRRRAANESSQGEPRP